MKMDGIRQQLFIDYMYYLRETDRFYATKARYACLQAFLCKNVFEEKP